jgi:hypothetical protein
MLDSPHITSQVVTVHPYTLLSFLRIILSNHRPSNIVLIDFLGLKRSSCLVTRLHDRYISQLL